MDKINLIKEIIKKRRTIRRFKQKPIEKNILLELIEYARLAPSAANLQPLKYLILNNKKLMDDFFPLLSWAAYLGEEGPPPEAQKPTAYIIALNDKNINSRFAWIDMGAAFENMLILATAYGIGSCWIDSVKRESAYKILNIPEHLEILDVIALGYPDEESNYEDLIDNNIKYYKDNNNKMHVPKRHVKNIVFFNKF